MERVLGHPQAERRLDQGASWCVTRITVNVSLTEIIAGLQLKIVAEDKVIDARIHGFITEWESNK